MRPANSKVASDLQLELVAEDERRAILSTNLRFGGPGNPRYDDLVRELKSVQPGLAVEVVDVEGWRKRQAEVELV